MRYPLSFSQCKEQVQFATRKKKTRVSFQVLNKKKKKFSFRFSVLPLKHRSLHVYSAIQALIFLQLFSEFSMDSTDIESCSVIRSCKCLI